MGIFNRGLSNQTDISSQKREKKPKSKGRKKPKRTGKPNGRPPSYSLALSNKICELLSSGRSLTQICEMKGMPKYPTVMSWLWKDTSFKEDFNYRYGQAREEQAHYMADLMLDISDDGKNDYYKDSKGNVLLNAENIQRSRLRIDARKWIAARLLPKKYGDKTELTGKDGNPLIPPASTSILLDFGV